MSKTHTRKLSAALTTWPSLFFCLLLFAAVRPAAGQTKIDYVVDARRLSRSTLEITASVVGLAPGTVAFQIGQLKSKEGITGHVSRPAVKSGQQQLDLVELEEGEYSFEKSGSGPVQIIYSIRSARHEEIARHTYVDPHRSVLYPAEVMLRFSNKRVRSAFSFVLLDGWKVISVDKPTREGLFVLDSEQLTYFYIGEKGRAVAFVEAGSAVVVEATWPVAEAATLLELRKQLRFAELSDAHAAAVPKLVLLLGGLQTSEKSAVLSSVGDQVLVLTVKGTTDQTRIIEPVRQRLAECFVALRFPWIGLPEVSPITESLKQYLVAKYLLKTGSLGPAEFLEEVSKGFVTVPEEPDLSLDRPEIGNGPTVAKQPSAAIVRTRGLLAFFLSDLVMEFANRRSLEGLLSRKPINDSSTATISEQVVKQLNTEPGVKRILDRVLLSVELDPTSTLLKPFGLLLEKREVPIFGFELSESFHVTSVVRNGAERSRLQVGDRVIAINQQRFVRSSDLIRFLSSQTTEGLIEITVERHGSVLKLKHQVPTESYFMLQINRLADADKQEKLRSFLAKLVTVV